MSEKPSVDRRNFLKSAAATGAAALAASHAAAARAAASRRRPLKPRAPVAPREVDPAGSVEVLTTDRPGGDFMVDVIKTLNFEYIASNPGSSFRGIHESLINYGGNQRAGVHHLLPRRVVGGDGARLLQGRRQADGGAVSRHGRHAARGDGDLQRLLRPRAGLHPRRQLARRDAAAAGRRMGAQRAGRGGDGPRLHQVGRSAGLAAALRRVGGARLQDRDDAADDAGAAGHRRRTAGRSDLAGGQRRAFAFRGSR